MGLVTGIGSKLYGKGPSDCGNGMLDLLMFTSLVSTTWQSICIMVIESSGGCLPSVHVSGEENPRRSPLLHMRVHVSQGPNLTRVKAHA